MNKPIILAHRGASAYAPENTLASVNLAWEMNSDAVEIDVRISSDGEVVAIHDPNTLRTTGKNHHVRKTSSHTLRELDAASNNFHYSPQRIPFAEEIIDTIPPGKKLFIELKNGKDTIPLLKNIADQSGKQDSIIYMSFDPSVTILLRKNMPNNPVFLLKRVLHLFPFWHSAARTIRVAKSQGLDGVGIEYPMIDEKLIEDAVSKGLEMHAWTVNDIETCLSLAGSGVHGITTDIPDMMLQALTRKAVFPD